MGGGKYKFRDGEQIDTSFSRLLLHDLPRSTGLHRKPDLKVSILTPLMTKLETQENLVSVLKRTPTARVLTL